MEGPRKNLGTTRSADEVASEEELENDASFAEDEEDTSPRMDPELIKALGSLKRIQASTATRASDLVDLLVKRREPLPQP